MKIMVLYIVPQEGSRRLKYMDTGNVSKNDLIEENGKNMDLNLDLFLCRSNCDTWCGADG